MALFNFRSDRMVEISKAFEYEDFNAFDRKRFPKVCLSLVHPLNHCVSTVADCRSYRRCRRRLTYYCKEAHASASWVM